MIKLYIHVDLLKITENLICTMKNILKWFRLNYFKADPGEFQFKILGDKTCYEHMLKINLTCVQSSDDVTLLGIITDKSLTFKNILTISFARPSTNFMLCGVLEDFTL